ncbi:MAG: nucleotidyl transferase AbiEii/AbiGii toxin family protein [Candidatus Brocadiae bacterium]|nr:nucleotidyl transferase AbiEii/AbiGii toxin family protein [Candidatus Brocadiia bacterium]
MTERRGPNLPASVRQRLLNLSRERGEDFGLVLSHYAIERFLYRLSQSPHATRFILKGAMLFAVWTGRMHRPTRDLDLLAFGDTSDDALVEIVRAVCSQPVEPDGIEFDPATLQAEPIREGADYEGRRVRLMAALSGARIDLRIDIGVGDAVVPAPQPVDYPTLLDFPAPRLRACPRETVVAEKLHAMVDRGILNSRMKDFYDIWTMARRFPFDGATLARAIRATFDRRDTPIPATPPVALTAAFARDAQKLTQWKAFLRRHALDAAGLEFGSIIDELRGFLEPPLTALAARVPFVVTWPPSGPWQMAIAR